MAERDIESLRMMGWGFATAENCSVGRGRGRRVLQVGTIIYIEYIHLEGKHRFSEE